MYINCVYSKREKCFNYARWGVSLKTQAKTGENTYKINTLEKPALLLTYHEIVFLIQKLDVALLTLFESKKRVKNEMKRSI